MAKKPDKRHRDVAKTKGKHTKKALKAAEATALQPPHGALPTEDICSLLRAAPGVRMSDLDPGATPGYPGRGKVDAPRLTAQLAPALSDWQERLYAESRDESLPSRSVLVVLQGMDTSGKGGTIRHVFGLVDPQGLSMHAFKQPSPEELSHDFLWRIRQHLPQRGMIGIFDRSHYEDVLIARVDGLVGQSEWEKRYDLINQFEAELAQSGTTIIKCFLHISPDEQKKRLLERLEDPDKYWKYSSGDVVVRRKWDLYQSAYQDMLDRCSTGIAPWYVIPSDRKWYRNWAVAVLLLAHLRAMRPVWPKAEFDVAHEIAEVENSLNPTT